MLRRLLKIVAGVVAAFVLIAVALVTVVLLRWDRTFDAEYPPVHASTDPTVIQRGEYIVNGPAHCVGCHTSNDQADQVAAGAILPLTGGNVIRLPFGTIFTPNITPDRETGIGRRTDAELARILRYGVRHDGRVAMPFMEFHHMSDEDLTAVISYLRAQPAVRRENPEHSFNLLGKTILAFLMKPVGPTQDPPKASPPADGSVARGEYLANSVAACAACHTKRNPLDGSYAGPRFAGGMEIDVEGDPDAVFVSPNLTPEPQTGRIASWSEEQFIGRFGAGVGLPGTHMPWRQYQRMSEEDLAAIYRYLRTLEPVVHATGPSMQQRKREGAPETSVASVAPAQ
jgi:mono/diheme cytochrome c family protein